MPVGKLKYVTLINIFRLKIRNRYWFGPSWYSGLRMPMNICNRCPFCIGLQLWKLFNAR